MGIGKSDLMKRAMPCGRRNLITDVPGVTVGHVTLREGTARTGVTALIPAPGDLFHSKVRAACHVVNGFGKTAGLVQVKELGTIETPIVVTNTLSVGDCLSGLCRYMTEQCGDIGLSAGTVNPIVAECNDGILNEIRAMHVRPEHVSQAIAAASEDFEEGACGAGTGMVCFGMKGGIGSASRVFELDGKEYVLGALLVTNFGGLGDFMPGGRHIGPNLAKITSKLYENDSGSVIMILGTDAPVSCRQLERICRRAVVGLARTGSRVGHGSGDIVIAFSNASRPEHEPAGEIMPDLELAETSMHKLFLAAEDAVEESVLSSLTHAVDTEGMGRKIYSLNTLLKLHEEGNFR